MEDNYTGENPMRGSSLGTSAFGEYARAFTPEEQVLQRKELIRIAKLEKKETLEGLRLRKGFTTNFTANRDAYIENFGDVVQVFTDQQIEELYQARCSDMLLEFKPLQLKKFKHQIQ